MTEERFQFFGWLGLISIVAAFVWYQIREEKKSRKESEERLKAEEEKKQKIREEWEEMQKRDKFRHEMMSPFIDLFNRLCDEYGIEDFDELRKKTHLKDSRSREILINTANELRHLIFEAFSSPEYWMQGWIKEAIPLIVVNTEAQYKKSKGYGFTIMAANWGVTDTIALHVDFIYFVKENYDEILEKVFYKRVSQNIKISENARQAHTYIIGASKSGKSELIKDLIFSDFQKGNKSVILIEPHGDLAEQVAKLKDKDNSNLVYIDFTLDPTKTPVLNPFDISDRSSENIEIQAQALIDAFEDILGSEFSTQMEELLGATIRTLMQTGKGDFWELRRFMDDDNNSNLIDAGKASPNPKDRLFFNDGSFTQNSYKPTKNSLKSKIGTYLGYAVFRNFTTGKSTIDLKKLTDGKKWVIFNLSKGNIGKKVSPILGRFVIASLQNIILQRAKTQHRTPVYLYIDEFQNYTSETIEEIFSESRKYGFHLTIAHQNTGQLLGKMKDLIFSNTSVKIVGRNDTDQLKKLSNQILVEFEELDKMTTGNFYMRVEKNQAQPIKVGTKLLDNKYSMTPQEWEQVKAEQLAAYYTKIEQREPPTVSEPDSDKFNFNPSDTTV